MPTENNALITTAERSYFSLTKAQTDSLKPLGHDTSVTRFTEMLNSVVDLKKVVKFNSVVLFEWLITRSLITRSEYNKAQYSATPDGESVGMINDTYEKADGFKTDYVSLTPAAQQFLFDNMDSIIEFQMENIRKEWGKKSDYSLTDAQKSALAPIKERNAGITDVLNILNSKLNENTVNLLRHGTLMCWLRQKSFISNYINEKTNRVNTAITPEGEKAGLFNGELIDRKGNPYTYICFSPELQRKILDSADELAQLQKSEFKRMTTPLD